MLCQFYFLSSGQVSEYLVDTNKLWSNLWGTSPMGPPPVLYSTNFVRFGGDTMIGQHHYNNIYQTYDSSMSTWNMIGCIREDSDHRVYFLRKQDTIERMLYDFNVQAGDTIYAWNFWLNKAEIHHVYGIDSAFVYDRWIKRILLDVYYWYEGIGDVRGVLYTEAGFSVGNGWWLQCYYDEGILKYQNPILYWSSLGCYANNIYLGYINKGSSELRIYPSPFSVYTTIEYMLKEPAAVGLRIYNQQGELVQTIEQNQAAGLNKNRWEPENLPNGIYYLRLTTADQIATAKVIRQR
jgi:hypothetical protein